MKTNWCQNQNPLNKPNSHKVINIIIFFIKTLFSFIEEPKEEVEEEKSPKKREIYEQNRESSKEH